METAQRVQQMAASATLAMSQRSALLKAQGIDIINLSVGEPDFPTPENIAAAARQAITDGYTHYTPVSGYETLRQAIAAKLARENALTYTPSQILVSNGAKQCISLALLALLNPGDEVIIPTPYWVSYPELTRLAEGTPVFIETTINNNFKITPAQLEAAITPRTRAIILCSPSNPTGAVYTHSELEELASVLSHHPAITIISDEIYEHINYIGSHASLAQIDSIRQRVIIINGVSKAYAMTGWRIGWLAAQDETIVKACTKLQGQMTSGAGSISQKAAEQAYNGTQQYVEDMRQAFLRRRNLILQRCKEIPHFEINEPQGAFYLFPKVNHYFNKKIGNTLIRNADDLAMFLLNEGHVATVSGNAFGASDYLRISYAASEENIAEAMKRIKQLLTK